MENHLRQWMRLVEESASLTLQTIADHLVEVNDDILPDHYFEIEWLNVSDAECLDLIKRIFLHGSCGEFAYALHEKHGWPIVRFNNKTFSKVHYACKITDDEYCDFAGRINLTTILQRYRFGKTVIMNEVSPDECASGFDLDDSNPWGGVAIAKFMMNYLHL